MRLPTLQTLTWGTIVASIASALLLAGDDDQGLPLLVPRAEHSSRPGADDRQAPDHAAGRRGNGHVPAHPRRDERNGVRGPR